MAQRPTSLQQKANNLYQILNSVNGLEEARTNDGECKHICMFYYVLGMERNEQQILLRKWRYENLSLVSMVLGPYTKYEYE